MKKILAMVLAMMLVLSMSAAFAEDPILIADGVINKIYTLQDDDTAPMEDLALTITCTNIEHAGTGATYTTETAPKPEWDYDVVNKKWTLENPALEEVGVYTYEIFEVAADNSGVTSYDDETAIAVQYIAYFDANQEIVVEGPYSVLATDATAKKDDFTNVYNAYDLTINKTIAGNMGNFDDTFTVTLTFTSDTPVVNDITLTDADDNTDATLNGENEATDTTETEWEYNSETKKYQATKTVTVGGSEESTVTVTGIPSGVTVKVAETVKADDDYVVTYAVDGTDQAEGTTDVTVTMTANHDVDITNTNEQAVATGIILDNAPYMILMALVVIAGAALIVKRASANR